MIKIFDKIKFWYKNARPYSVPITILSWLVIFTYGIMHGGDILNGIIALFGVLPVHLATNLSDDYIDYKRLVRDESFFKKSKSIKCAYIRNGQATITDLRNAIIFMLSFAAILGGVLLFRSGIGVIFFALAVLPIALFYSKLSSKGFGDIAVILTYGPLLFEGVYYVMTKTVSADVLLLSIPCSLLVEAILYAHMYMDFDEDVNSGKTTLCTLLKTKNNALIVFCLIYALSYILMIIISLKTKNYYYLAPLITLPMLFKLVKMLKDYDVSIKRQYSSVCEKTLDVPFFERFIYCRNLTIVFMIIVFIAIIVY